MSKDQILSILFLIVCFITVYMAFFYIRKNRFLNTDDFAMFRDGIFPPHPQFLVDQNFRYCGEFVYNLFWHSIGHKRIQLIERIREEK